MPISWLTKSIIACFILLIIFGFLTWKEKRKRDEKVKNYFKTYGDREQARKEWL